MITKTCTKCKEVKPISEFNKAKSGKYGVRGDCKECHWLSYKNNNNDKINQRAREYRKNNPDKIRKNNQKYKENNKEQLKNKHLEKLYGITLKEYKQLLKEQNGVCKICGGTCKKDLHVDHCHDTGEIRGLLCVRCNVALGHFQDDITLLQKAIEYLS